MEDRSEKRVGLKERERKGTLRKEGFGESLELSCREVGCEGLAESIKGLGTYCLHLISVEPRP